MVEGPFSSRSPERTAWHFPALRLLLPSPMKGLRANCMDAGAAVGLSAPQPPPRHQGREPRPVVGSHRGTLPLLSAVMSCSGLEQKRKETHLDCWRIMNFRLLCCVRKRRGKKEPPLRTVDEGLYWAVALGQNSRERVSEETKGVCEV